MSGLPLKFSAIELDHLEQVTLSAGYAILRDKLEREANKALEEVIRASSWEQYLDARGRLRGIRLAISAPEILKTEITAKIDKGVA